MGEGAPSIPPQSEGRGTTAPNAFLPRTSGTLGHHSIVWHLFGDKKEKFHETEVCYSILNNTPRPFKRRLSLKRFFPQNVMLCNYNAVTPYHLIT